MSEGFCGRASDAFIVENSKYLDALPSNCAVMTDRGFKHVNSLLQKKNCILVRPPNVTSGENLTKAEVLETKRIASLRILIERVIHRVREFKFLKSHSCIQNSQMDLVDDVVFVAAALINFQSPIIDQY